MSDDERRPWELPSLPISKPRRSSLGDLMMFVVLAALGLSIVASLSGSPLNRRLRVGFMVMSLLYLGLVLSFWQISNLSARGSDIATRRVTGVVVVIVFALAIVRVAGLAVVSPEATIRIVGFTLVLSIYATTWD